MIVDTSLLSFRYGQGLITRRVLPPNLDTEADRLCSWCKLPLIKASINSHYVFLCDNIKCPKFREQQGYEKKPPPIESELDKQRRQEFNLRRKLLPCYKANLERKKLNYRRLRQAGISSKKATLWSSDKKTREILGE